MSAEVTVENTPLQDQGQIERSLIDASTRVPVLLFFGTGLLWLLLGSVLALIANIKLHTPEFLGDFSFLTYGRLVAAEQIVMLYGWASLGGIGAAIWIMARLCRVQLRYPLLVSAGVVLWNLGLLSGVLAVLTGGGTGLNWIEFPSHTAVILFIGYAVIGVWAVIMYSQRRSGHIFASQWYFLTAFFAFPWVFITGWLLLLVSPGPGVIQAAVNFWFAGNLFGLWLTALGLGIAYYLIPKVTGKPIYSYHLAAFGFWTFVLFYSWRGRPEMLGGPLPVWVVTAAIVAAVLTLIPVATVAVNHHMTMRGHFFMMHYSPTLRFTVVGAMSYTAASLMAAFLSLRSAGEVFRFTLAHTAQIQLELYAFVTMVIFGAIYYIVPRLVGCEWRSSWLIKLHFWGAAYGIGLLVAMLGIAGLVQGTMLGDIEEGFIKSIEGARPLLIGASLGRVMLLLGHTVLAFHFLIMILRLGRPGGTPTLLIEQEEP